MLTGDMRSRLFATLVMTTALLVLASPAPRTARAAEPVDLEGTWFVLIHYRDAKTANPESDRWLDLVWTFALKGTRLEWSEFPLVVFADTAGRFEAISGNPRSRVLAAWEPNGAQMTTITEGPRVNERGSKVKTLKGSDAKGWRSSRRMTTTSAMVVGYQENLTIEAKGGMPVFIREDILGNAYKKSGEGMTRYETTEVQGGGRTLKGRYSRDDHKQGEFRMWRTAPVRGLVEKKGTPNERRADRAEDAYKRYLQAEHELNDAARDAAVEDLKRRAAEGDPEAIRIIKEHLRDPQGPPQR
jgi:hypothetical protein